MVKSAKSCHLSGATRLAFTLVLMMIQAMVLKTNEMMGTAMPYWRKTELVSCGWRPNSTMDPAVTSN